jgi:hypothetical protein
MLLSANGDHPMTTDLSKKQLTTILSALDDAPRSPANKGEALRAIGRSAGRFGLTADDVLAAAPGLLDGRMSAADFRAELHDLGRAPVPATEASQSAPDAHDGDAAGAGSRRRRPSRHRRPRRPQRASAGPRLPSLQSRSRLHRPTSPRRAPAPSRRG